MFEKVKKFCKENAADLIGTGVATLLGGLIIGGAAMLSTSAYRSGYHKGIVDTVNYLSRVVSEEK